MDLNNVNCNLELFYVKILTIPRGNEFSLKNFSLNTFFEKRRQSVNSHQNFTKKFNLPFPLISDNEEKLMKYFGVGDVLPLLPFPKRVTF